MSLIRLAYASEATFKPMPLEQGIEPNVSRILMASRRNNPKRELVGGLYFGDGHFFQYLEGEEKEVHEIYDRICRDSRHRSVRKLIEEPLQARTFANWSMKYVPVADDVQQFLRRNNFKRFDPFAFDRKQCEQMIQLVRASSHDERSVNYRDAASASARAEPLPGSQKTGLIIVGVVVVVALAAVGFLIPG